MSKLQFGFTIIFLTATLKCAAQKTLFPRTIINWPLGKIFYLDKPNIVFITTKPATTDSLIIETSNGTVSPDFLGKGFYEIEPDSAGQILMRIYIIRNNQKTELIKRKFIVKISKELKKLNSLKIKPDIQISDYSGRLIPLDSAKKVHCVTINQRYRIVSLTAYFSGGGDTFPQYLSSNCFNNLFQQIWDRISSGTIITFTLIKLRDIVTKEMFFIPDISFRII